MFFFFSGGGVQVHGRSRTLRGTLFFLGGWGGSGFSGGRGGGGSGSGSGSGSGFTGWVQGFQVLVEVRVRGALFFAGRRGEVRIRVGSGSRVQDGFGV